MPSRSVVLGIDPGFDRCGVAVLEKDGLIYSTCLSTDKKSAQAQRLLELSGKLSVVIKKYRPVSLAIEKLFFNINVKTALKVAEARGVILALAAEHGLEIFEYSPQDVKIAVTGYGKASKAQVEEMTARLLKLKTAPKFDDEADAMALCITHLAHHRSI